MNRKILQSKKNPLRKTVSSYKLEIDKIKPVRKGFLYVSNMGMWLPVEDYIKLVQTGQIKLK